MYRTKTETKLIWWPTPQDYNEAVQIPQISLQDPELKQGLPYTNALDLPRSVTGSFASVYRMHCPNRDFALRLFLSNIHDQQERYALISDFVQHDDLPYTVGFDFLKQGIKVRGDWLPALKMDWLEGEQLDDYIVHNLGNPQKLGHLLEIFLKMMHDLHQVGIAHGDLQHGNILVCNNELRLVDYDGMFVPAMKGFMASELGHRNYQHPNRSAHHFGPYLDNFSAWIIYASIRALQIDSRLMHHLGGGDDCLLFRQADFMDPLHSPAFAALERHPDKRLNELGRFIRAQLKQDLPDIPFLEISLPESVVHDLHPISDTASTVKRGARIIRGNLPDWLQDDNVAVLTNAQTSSPAQPISEPHLQSPNPVPHFQSPNPPPHLQPPNSVPHSQSPNPAPHLQLPNQAPHLQPPAQQPSKPQPKSSKYNPTLPPVTPLTAPPPQSWTMPARPNQQAVWLKPGVASTLMQSQPSINAQPIMQPPPLSGSTNQINKPANLVRGVPAQPSTSQSAPQAPSQGRSNKLNQLTNTISTASQRKQQQIAASQQQQLQSNPKSHVPAAPAVVLPPELVTGSVPRKVQWNPHCSHLSPRNLAQVMLLNPLFWIMFNVGAHAYGVDSWLATHGTQVPAVVTNVEYHAASRNGYTQVDYNYTLDNQVYHKSEHILGDASEFQKGGKYEITVLPSDPNVTEGLNAPPGHKKLVDLAYFGLLALVNTITYAILCAPSLRQRTLASQGQAYIAEIDDLRTNWRNEFQVDVSWPANGSHWYRTVKVTADQYNSLRVGDLEVILFDEQTQDLAFYRFCRYQGKLPQASAIKKVGP